MKNFTFLIIFGILSINAYSQNLVPNPSFEEMISCPTGSTSLIYSIGWFSPDSDRTPDFLHECAAGNEFTGIPGAFSGTQPPHSGSGYAGIIEKNVGLSGEPFLGSEQIAIQLSTPLSIGTKYYVRFYVSLAEVSHWTSEALGLKFFVDQPSWPYPDYPSDPDVHDIDYQFIVDKTSWTYISGEFIADSTYNYIMIGDYDVIGDTTLFYELSDGEYPWSPGSNFSCAYFYIDDVCVSANPTDCGELIDLSIPTIGSAEKKLLKITDFMGIKTEDKPNKLLIYIYNDGTTEKVFRVE